MKKKKISVDTRNTRMRRETIKWINNVPPFNSVKQFTSTILHFSIVLLTILVLLSICKPSFNSVGTGHFFNLFYIITSRMKFTRDTDWCNLRRFGFLFLLKHDNYWGRLEKEKSSVLLVTSTSFLLFKEDKKEPQK